MFGNKVEEPNNEIDKIKKEEHFDIIFMDQVMEEMSGIETMKALKSLTEYKIPPQSWSCCRASYSSAGAR